MEPFTSPILEGSSPIQFKSWFMPNPSLFFPCSRLRVKKKAKTTLTGTRTWKFSAVVASSASWSCNPTDGGKTVAQSQKCVDSEEKRKNKKRVFFLDVNPLCYAGSTPSLYSFAHWISLFFSEVSHNHPVIAVIDGEKGNEYRRRLLPSYKAHRQKFSRQTPASQFFHKGSIGSSRLVIADILKKCNVPVVKVEDHEADDVVATLVGEVLQRGYLVVIASPDKDFKQLISEDVQIVMPMPEFNRWSFYTLKHYIAQYSCDPCSDLSLRSMIGDEADGVPGIQHVAPGFGRKTALKLLKKHGSLEKLLNAAAVRTVGRQYAQDALMKYADYLRRNYEVLALKSNDTGMLMFIFKRSGCLTETRRMILLFYPTSSNFWEKPKSSIAKISLILQMVKLDNILSSITPNLGALTTRFNRDQFKDMLHFRASLSLSLTLMHTACVEKVCFHQTCRLL